MHSIITVFIIYPAFLAWTLLGTIWYIENTSVATKEEEVNLNNIKDYGKESTITNEPTVNTYKCFSTEDTMSWYFLTWIVCFYVLIIIATTIISYAAILYYRQRLFEQQYESLLQQYGEDERPQMNFNLYGLSPQQIVQTSRVINAAEGEGECSICIENFNDGEKVRVLSCGHKYHLPCIDVWLMQHPSCPLCKADFNRAIGN